MVEVRAITKEYHSSSGVKILMSFEEANKNSK